MGVFVICSYRPKKGQEELLKAVIERHVPALRAEGLLGDGPSLMMKAGDGSIVEIFEWKSEDHARSAEANPAVQEIWAEFAEICDFVPLASLEECRQPFAHFTSLA